MSRNSSQRLIVWGSAESMWPPLTMLANTGVVFGSASISAGHWGPVCSSCRAPDTKTGTWMCAAQSVMERRSKSDGSRPAPVPGATCCAPARLALSDWSCSAWLSRQADGVPGGSAASSASIS